MCKRVFKTKKEKKKTGVTHDLGFEYVRPQFQDCLGTQSPFSVVVVVVCVVVVSLYATRAGVPHRSPLCERERDGDRREEERRRKKTSAKETGGEV